MKWSVVYGSSTSFCDKDVLRCIYMDTCDTWGFGKESRPNLLHLYQHGLEGQTTVVERTTDSQQRLSSPLVYGLLI